MATMLTSSGHEIDVPDDLANEIAARAATRGYGADPDIALAPKPSIFDRGATAQGPAPGTVVRPDWVTPLSPQETSDAPAGVLGVQTRTGGLDAGVEQSEGTTKDYAMLDELRKRVMGGTYSKPGWYGAERVTTRDGLTEEQRAAIRDLNITRQADAITTAREKHELSIGQAERLAGATAGAAKLAEDIIAPHEERMRDIDARAKNRQELADILSAQADRAEGEGTDAGRLARKNPWAFALMGFGAALGASGAALTHSENYAGKMLNQAIEDDIAEQRTNLSLLRQRAETNAKAADALRAMGPTEIARARSALDLAKGVSEAKLRAAAAANGVDEASKEFKDAMLAVHKDYFDRAEKLIRDEAGTVSLKEKYNQGGYRPNGTVAEALAVAREYGDVGSGQETRAAAAGKDAKASGGASGSGIMVPTPGGGAAPVADKKTAQRLLTMAGDTLDGREALNSAIAVLQANPEKAAIKGTAENKIVREGIAKAMETQQKQRAQGVLREGDAKLHEGLLNTYNWNPALVAVLQDAAAGFDRTYKAHYDAAVNPAGLFATKGATSAPTQSPAATQPPAQPQAPPPPPTGATFKGGKWDARKDTP